MFGIDRATESDQGVTSRDVPIKSEIEKINYHKPLKNLCQSLKFKRNWLQ